MTVCVVLDGKGESGFIDLSQKIACGLFSVRCTFYDPTLPIPRLLFSKSKEITLQIKLNIFISQGKERKILSKSGLEGVNISVFKFL